MSAIISPSRTLWTPSTERVARRVRKFLQEIARPFWLNEDGKWLIDDNGKFYVCDDCPCAGGCGDLPGTILLNFAGVEAAACTGCATDGSTSMQPGSLAGFDGTYAIPLDNESLGFGDNFCTYFTQNVGFTWQWTGYGFGVTNCTGEGFTQMEELDLVAVFWKADSSIRLIQAREGGTGAAVIFDSGFFAQGVKPFGSPIANTITCGGISGIFTGPYMSNGGTATVST